MKVVMRIQKIKRIVEVTLILSGTFLVLWGFITYLIGIE
ncbi:hypothetical protein LCGC14_2937440 [marine sediment metagenome]|uniref:Uncharacterized protein n=1 Tax=marine sediment metagenome TaxID=412755 RepID=A0A0F8ZRU2_9ZZZZ